ncbi:hypothetical protein ScPMuIL_007220 [Solemya velum]
MRSRRDDVQLFQGNRVDKTHIVSKMGEMVRRLDYERRAKNLVRQDPKRRFRHKEYSQSVKSQNAMAVRTGELYLRRAATDLDNFQLRHSVEVFQLNDLRKSIDSKLLDFNPSEFRKTLRKNTPKHDHPNANNSERKIEPRKPQNLLLAKKRVLRRSQSAHPRLYSRTPMVSTASDLKRTTSLRIKTATLRTPEIATGGEDAADFKNWKQSRSFRSIKNSFTAREVEQPNFQELRLKRFKDKELDHNAILDKKVQMLCRQIHTMVPR